MHCCYDNGLGVASSASKETVTSHYNSINPI
jgi:hypothetical protein